MMGRGEFLKIRAGKFFKNGKYLMGNKDYDLAAFNFEQSAQLFLKFYLFLQVGTYPFSPSIKELLSEVFKIHPQKGKIEKMLEENKEIIIDLEEAYISSRYLPSTFSEGRVKKMRGFVIKLKNLLL